MANNENLTPWKPGQSGNPKGKPKGILDTKTYLKRFLAVDSGEEHPTTGEQMNCFEKALLTAIQGAMAGDLKALKEIIDRIEGQSEITGEVTHGYNFKDMSEEQIEAFLKQHGKEKG